MKRKITSSLIIILLIALGVLGYKYFDKAEAGGSVWGLGKSFESLEEIKADSDLIVRVHIPLYYDIREIGEEEMTTKQAFYEVAIDEVFLDRTGHGFDEDSEIVVNQVIGMKNSEAEGYSAEKGMRPLKTGDYLLFLKKVTHPTDGNTYYVSNSSRHIYKLRGKNTFKNIASDELMEIDYSELDGGR
ncbi:hypothetical protein [Planomicrobium sp. MB-3u-38]|uniref:hypothetical protein n=1 Tax=Planomicrobium sp. MB-3u-38 TaxID=2058318 RepID=UPI000C7A8960|nr:hypothetical protein [Planomicrobium sp. MB-3u-38]PKH11302.1 hypothetical protein CXF70_05270 [Planomicrobium sp. MB-3u-38]